MSTVLHPVGGEPPRVYWIRRGVLLAIVLVILIAAVWFIGGRGGGGSATPSPTGSGSPTPSASPSGSPSPSPSASSSKKPSTSPSASSAATVAACKDAAISVTVSTDAATYPVGSTPKLTMRITNSSTTPCKRDVGAKANELALKSGDTTFWSSDDCNASDASEVVTMAAGQSYSVTVTWNGSGSSAGCPSDPPAATAGTYSLVGRNDKVVSKPATFKLT